MSLTFKLLSLAIRTAAKPIGNYIKRQAKDHDGFRRLAVRQAQRVHRIDMKMRLGILHDPVAQDRMHEREQKAAEDKKRKAETPIVRTKEEQRVHDEEVAKAEKEGLKKESEKPKIKIRPLSEAKAIDLGANFFSEAFIFAVAAGLLVFDAIRSRKKESARRDDVAERLEGLEAEVTRLRSKFEPGAAALYEKAKTRDTTPWWNPAGWWTRVEQVDVPSEAGGVLAISGNVPGDKTVKPSKEPNTAEKEAIPAIVIDRAVRENSPASVDASPKAPERVDSPRFLGLFSCRTLRDEKMFCASLRRRPSFSSIVPALLPPSSLALRESQLTTHDLSVPLHSTVCPRNGSTITTRALRLLLLSPRSVARAQLAATIQRVQRFASLTGGQDLAIVFLLASTPAASFISARTLIEPATDFSLQQQEGLHAYATLQSLLLDQESGIPYLPILPVATLDHLPHLVRDHVKNLTHHPTLARAHNPTTPAATALDLLTLCTARSGQPMLQHTAYVLSDLFPNLASLSEACCTRMTSAPNSSSPSARAAGGDSHHQVLLMRDQTHGPEFPRASVGPMEILRDLVGAGECTEILDWWNNEWVMD